MGAEVAVSGDPERPTFTFRKAGFHLSNRLSFPGSLEVFEITDRSQQILWWVHANLGPDAGLPDHLRYGEVPAGARTNTSSPPPLRPGAIHAVHLSGLGYWGGVSFATIGGKLETGSYEELRQRLAS